VIDNAQVGGSIVAFDQGSTRLAFGDWRGSIGLRGLADGDAARRWRAHAGTVNGLAFLDGGQRILSAGYDGELAEWDTQGRRLRRVRTGSPVMAPSRPPAAAPPRGGPRRHRARRRLSAGPTIHRLQRQ